MIKVLLEGPAAKPNRASIVNKTSKESPGRVKRSKEYTNKKGNCRGIEMNKLISDDRLTIEVDVRGTQLYTCTLSFGYFMGYLRDIINSKDGEQETVTFNDIQRALMQSIDDSDNLQVFCTCDDYRYRYHFWSTQSGFNYGTPQNDNGKKIRNPNNDIGAVCKHLYSLLVNKSWLTKVASWLNDYIKRHPKVFAQALDISQDALIKNKLQYNLGKASNAPDEETKSKYIDRWRQGLEQKNSDSDEEDSEEETKEESIRFRNKNIKVEGYLDDDAYYYKQLYADRKSQENEEIALENGLTEEQTDIIETITRLRHELHSEDVETIFNDQVEYPDSYKYFFDDTAEENYVNTQLKKVGLPELKLPSWGTHFTEWDFDEEVKERGIEEYSKEWEELRSEYLSNLTEDLDKANTTIENWLGEIDEKYGTQYKPTGMSRIF